MIQENAQVQDFSKYELDKDIPDSIWSAYMKKYSGKYQIKTNDDGVWCIKCKFGTIEPYSLKKGYLMFFGIFPTSSKKTYFLKKFKDLDVEVVQEATEEVNIKFSEKALHLLGEFFDVRKRKKLSDEHLEKLRNNMDKINKEKKND